MRDYPPSRFEEDGETGAPAAAVAESPQPLLEAPERSHRVLVTGGTGFLGRHLLPRLVARGHSVRVLARRRPAGKLSELSVGWWTGDVTDSTDVIGAAEGCDRVVHLAGSFVPERESGSAEDVHFRGTRNVLWEAEDAGVERFVYASVLGARPGGSPFFRAKFRAEREVRGADLEGIVLRPAVVYGPGDHLISAVREILRRYPFFPLFGVDDFPLQPVAVEDVVEAFCQGVERSGFVGDSFELGGPAPLTFREVVEAVGAVDGNPGRVVRLPAGLAGPAAALARRLGWPSPLSPGRLERLRGTGVLQQQEHALRSVFRLEPLPFREVLADYF